MPTNRYIDINCDMGESLGSVIIGNDAAIFPWITSCNIACGFHGGDPVHMEKTIQAALEHGVQIGAHPSYPDMENFGRKKMQLKAEDLRSVLRYQLAALIGVTAALGGEVTYVKPHGALYNSAADDVDEARVILEAIASLGHDLAVMCLPDSAIEKVALVMSIPFIAEAFADRRYEENGRLVPRAMHEAVIRDPEIASKQALDIVLRNQVTSINSTSVAVRAQSICVHGDHPDTPEVLRGIDQAFKLHGIHKKAFEVRL